MGDELSPFEKILKYIQEQKKMPHVATNIALKELTWPPPNRAAENPSLDVSDTFPSVEDDSKTEDENSSKESKESTEDAASVDNSVPEESGKPEGDA